MNDIHATVADLTILLDRFVRLLSAPGCSDSFVASLQAAQNLKTAVGADFERPGFFRRGRKRAQREDVDTLRKQWQSAVRWQKNRGLKSKAQIRELICAKSGGRITYSWFIKVGLSSPHVAASTFERWCRDFPPKETQNIGRHRIAYVKDAMAECVKSVNRDAVAKNISLAGMSSLFGESAPIYVTHVTDEGAMAVKSYLHDRSLPSSLQTFIRGKTSKVQTHAVTVHANNAADEFFTELHALHKKDGKTTATSIIRTFENVLETIKKGIAAMPVGSNCKVARVVHIIVGDAVPTNDNACKRVLEYFTRHAFLWNMRYSMLVVKCSSHQSNLVVLVAITGSVLKDPVDKDLLCGTCSRLFKYLAPTYQEEFAANLRQLVVDRVQLVHEFSDECSLATMRKTAQLQALYGEGVFPISLTRLLKRSLAEFEVCCPQGTDRSEICGELFRALLPLVVKLEEKPIVTRFWKFSQCVWSLLLIDILGLPAKVFTLRTVSPARDNSKRLDRVRAYFGNPSVPTQLRISSLALQLTQHATNMTGQSQKLPDDNRPIIVRLAQGEVQKHTAEHLRRLLPLLQYDDKLDVTAAVLRLLTTQGHIVMRFGRYAEYPGKLWLCCRAFNPIDYPEAVVAFLHTRDDDLDAGFSLGYKHEAWAQGSEADAVTYLMHRDRQTEMEDALRKMLGTSLDAERKINVDRLNEKNVPLGLARFSRNTILHRFLTHRETHLAEIMQLRKQAKKEVHQNMWAIARQRRPEMVPRPRGKLWWELGIAREDMQRLAHLGDALALRAYVEDNKEDLQREAQAKVADAKNTLVRLDSSSVPYTQQEWLVWMESNGERFRELVRTAHVARSVLNQRIMPMEELPMARRLQACEIAHEEYCWAKKLVQCGSGVASLQWLASGERTTVVLFFCSLRQKCRCILLDNIPVGYNEFVLARKSNFTADYLCASSIAALVFPPGFAHEIKVYTHTVQVMNAKTCGEDGIHFNIAGKSEEIVLAARAPRSRVEKDSDVESSDESGSHFSVAASDQESLMSEADSVAEEMEAEQVGDEEGEVRDEESDGDGVARAKAGSYTVFNNSYFTLSGRGDYPGCKMRIRPVWAVEGEMGKTSKSKTVTIATFDADGTPTRSYFVLRAWMLWRFTQHGFEAKVAARKAWRRRELAKLAGDIAALQIAGGGTGVRKVDICIRKLAPEVFAL